MIKITNWKYVTRTEEDTRTVYREKLRRLWRLNKGDQLILRAGGFDTENPDRVLDHYTHQQDDERLMTTVVIVFEDERLVEGYIE